MAAVCFAALTAVAAAAETEYTAEEAGKHVGETATVVGKAERVNKAAGGNIFISLGDRGRNAPFTIFISTKDAEKVGDVQQYEGKTIAVTGPITAFKEKPQIAVTAASQITVKEEAAASASASPAAESSPKK